jgi:diguanylate cyclase (GGDEF)-like protein
VSRRHSRIFRDAGGHCVEDLESTNGTFVNDVEVRGTVVLRNGDLIKCGGAVFKFIEGGNVEALYHEEIHRLTISDGLTQIANKRYFTEFIEREVSRATRHSRPLALLMFDIDHFKTVNDEYGHLMGDRVLCGVAQLVSREVRREELFARWGGEEFAIILPETTLHGARQFAERLRGIVQGAHFDYDGQSVSVTISLGATALSTGDTVESLIEKADSLLYQAKEQGRDRVCAG